MHTQASPYSDSWDDGSQVELIGYPNPHASSHNNCQYDPLYHSICRDTSGPHENTIVKKFTIIVRVGLV